MVDIDMAIPFLHVFVVGKVKLIWSTEAHLGGCPFEKERTLLNMINGVIIEDTSSSSFFTSKHTKPLVKKHHPEARNCSKWIFLVYKHKQRVLPGSDLKMQEESAPPFSFQALRRDAEALLKEGNIHINENVLDQLSSYRLNVADIQEKVKRVSLPLKFGNAIEVRVSVFVPSLCIVLFMCLLFNSV